MAQNYLTFSIPDSLINNANAVIRESVTTTIVRSISAISCTEEQTITILNNNAEELAEVVLPYDKLRKIKSFKAELFDKAGNKLRDFDKKDANDYSASGNNMAIDTRLKVWNLKGINFPYTIHYKYETETSSLFYINNWNPISSTGVSVEHATFNLIGNEINISNKTQFVQLKNHSNHDFTWELAGFKAIKKQLLMPNAYSVLPYVLLTAEEFELFGIKGSSKTWNDYGRFIYQLNEDRDVLNDITIPELEPLLNSNKTPLEKIQILYRYLQNNYRYVSIQLGIGGLQSQTAKYTYQQKFGDCKALVTLMKGLLKKAGIHSYMTLVNTQHDRIEPSADFVHFHFDHVILCVPIKNDTIWLECTSPFDPYNYLGRFTENRGVLVISEKGGTILRTPTYSESANTCSSFSQIKFEEDGSCSLYTNLILGGEKQELIRGLYYDNDSKNLQMAIISAMNLSSTRMQSFQILKIDTSLPLIHLSAVLTDNYTMKKTASRVIISPKILDPFKRYNNSNDNRTLPFQITDGVTYLDTLQIDLSDQYIPENFKANEHKELVSQFGFADFYVKVDSEHNYIMVYRRGCIKEQNYSASDYKAFNQFLLDVENIYSPTLVLKKRE